MQISLRLKLDIESDCAVAELELGTVVTRLSLGCVIPGAKPMTLDLDANGYIVSVTVPGLTTLLAGLEKANREIDATPRHRN